MKKEKTSLDASVQATIEMLGAKPMTPEQERQSESLSRTVFYSKKYRQGLNNVSLIKMREIIENHPEIPLTEFLSELMKDLNPEIPSEVLLELTQFIIAEWEKAKATEPFAV